MVYETHTKALFCFHKYFSGEILMTVNEKSGQLSCGYEIFIAAVSVLSVFNMFFAFIPGIDPDAVMVVYTVNAFLTLLLIADFGLRLFVAQSRSYYFFRDYGWADLLACAPLLRFLRLFRIVKAYRLVKKHGAKNLAGYVSEHRAEAAIFILVFMVIIIVEAGSYLVLLAESSSPDANILTSSDALWWTYVTIATVGYGDRYPVTEGGRLVGVLVMTAGVGVFVTFAGYIANKLLFRPRKKMENAVQVAGSLSPTAATLAELKKYLEERERIDAEISTSLERLEWLVALEGMRPDREPTK
jgi:voltage-gated potassium channel